VHVLVIIVNRMYKEISTGVFYMSDKQNTEKYLERRRVTGLKLAKAQVLVTTGLLTAQ